MDDRDGWRERERESHRNPCCQHDLMMRSGLLAGVERCVYISKFQSIGFISISRTEFSLYIYYLSVYLHLCLLKNAQWITFPTQSYIRLHFFFDSLLRSLIMRLTVSFLLPHNFCCVLSIFALLWEILMEIFCEVIKSDSVSLFRFHHNHILVTPCVISLVFRLKYLHCCFSSHNSSIISSSSSGQLQVVILDKVVHCMLKLLKKIWMIRDKGWLCW